MNLLNAGELVGASIGYIEALAPFILVFMAIACAGELIGLMRWAAGIYRKKYYRSDY